MALFLFFLIIVCPIIIFMLFLYLLNDKSCGGKTEYYGFDDYDDADFFTDDFMEDVCSEFYRQGYETGIQDCLEEVQKRINENQDSAWKPLPDYVDDYGYYCPDCDADLLDEDCEHHDDWI